MPTGGKPGLCIMYTWGQIPVPPFLCLFGMISKMILSPKNQSIFNLIRKLLWISECQLTVANSHYFGGDIARKGTLFVFVQILSLRQSKLKWNERNDAVAVNRDPFNSKLGTVS